jgi:hypothetical protein
VPDDVGDRPVRLRVPGVADQERLTPPVGHEIIRQAANRIKRFNFTLLALAVPAFGALAAARPARPAPRRPASATSRSPTAPRPSVSSATASPWASTTAATARPAAAAA